MIARLRGALAVKSALHVVVDVHGVGYRVFVPLSTFYSLPEVGQTVTLEIHTLVRDDALHLYGFRTWREKALFEQLLSVSKIGPKVAIGILSGISPEELVTAIEAGDTARINAVPGVGAKTAERIIVELRGKVAGKVWEGALEGQPSDGGGARAVTGESVSALVNLGYKRQEAERAVKAVLQRREGSDLSLEETIREALRHLSQ
ncbi:MAG: Holliday junction branch migration protein RuvA [Candidatus Tectomicrobia bacterium]|nr:Holliday junction branch migration protein RuvA [Candidatus Tectomicrobia bacterium]